jgi:hypothetical protein
VTTRLNSTTYASTRDVDLSQIGLKVGDIVLVINGKTSLESFESVLYKKAGTPLDILCSRQREERHAKFELKELLLLHGAMKAYGKDLSTK